MTSNINGRIIDPIAHVRQSVIDILTTPIGSRVMRRDYGSDLFNLIDSGITQEFFVKLYAATAKALIRWEPRFRMRHVIAQPIVDDVSNGRISMDIEGEYLVRITAQGIAEYEPIRMQGLVI